MDRTVALISVNSLTLLLTVGFLSFIFRWAIISKYPLQPQNSKMSPKYFYPDLYIFVGADIGAELSCLNLNIADRTLSDITCLRSSDTLYFSY